MREITAAIGMRLREAVDEDSKVGIQIGEPVSDSGRRGHAKPPRVHLVDVHYPNAGVTKVVVHMNESTGLGEAFEFPGFSGDDDAPERTAAEIIQGYLDDDTSSGSLRLFLAGNRGMMEDVTSLLDIPPDADVSIVRNEGRYVP